MRATVLHGAGDVRIEEVPGPVLHQPTDAVVRVTAPAGLRYLGRVGLGSGRAIPPSCARRGGYTAPSSRPA
ncbi:hypothetical protein [Pseudonocardia sp. H11422]|uniref:hypothetical protein n=1 Tax=Pseudonocardia sp. H11422 TaxID=2835866 RepID=UPI001BDBE653|nr:hypothetical protein [Pseudonocardia sp. H11422]